MWILLLEALAALLLLCGLVWWTMFSGRRGGERVPSPAPEGEAAADAAAAPVARADANSPTVTDPPTRH